MRTLLKGFVCTGNDIKRQAVLIENGNIAAVESDIFGSCAAEKQYTFRNEIIAPGFIDAHGHSDMSLPAAPEGFSKRTQGVTAEIAGNCGLSAFPLTGKNREHLLELYKIYQQNADWDDYRSYQEFLRRRQCQLKLFALCGHNTLRGAVAGYEKEQLSESELQEMQELLARQLDAGSPGLSTGLLYTPGCFAGEDELLRLMRQLARSGKVYATHLKSEGDGLLEALEQTLLLAETAGLQKVLISHFKTAGTANWHKLDRALELFNRFRHKGMQLYIDRYPYVESQTQLSVTLPPPCDTMTDRKITEYLADCGNFAEMLNKLRTFRDQDYWKRMRLAGTTHPRWKHFAGKKFTEFAGDIPQTVMEILRHDAVNATLAAAGMSEENMLRILQLDFCMPGSDGNALPPDYRFNRAHPRAFGTLPRFVRILLDQGTPLPQVCFRTSTMAAEFFNLPGIGHIRRGFCADITVFDPETIDSKADFSAPHTPAAGIIMTMLNGEAQFY